MHTLKRLTDTQLLAATQRLVKTERATTTAILRHLREIELRKLYADLGCGSLFEYAVRELGYSNSGAGRRIAAMRLVAEIPEVADKLESGALSLGSVCQAQSYFREMKQAAAGSRVGVNACATGTSISARTRASDVLASSVEGVPSSITTLQPQAGLSLEDKRAVLGRLEQKSTREAERILLELSGPHVLPPERTRQVTPEHTEVRFVLNTELKAQLETVRSLLGPKGVHLSFAELVAEMARLSAERLAEKKFGKRRATEACQVTPSPEASLPPASVLDPTSTSTPNAESATATEQSQPSLPPASTRASASTPNAESATATEQSPPSPHSTSTRIPTSTPSGGSSTAVAANSHPSGQRIGADAPSATFAARSRYVSQATRHAVWQKAHGRCQGCGTQRSLEVEHVQPFALGGTHELNNLKLLCRSCNLRRGVKTFGPQAMRRKLVGGR